MSIKERFPDNLIASTTLNTDLVPGLDVAAQKGPIVAAVGLDKIAENITIDMAAVAESTGHARPSLFASISSFAQNVISALETLAVGVSLDKYAALDKPVKKDFAEWQGLVAAVALNHIYSGTGLNISVDPVRLDSASLIHRCILMEMDKDRYYRAAITKRDPVTGEPLEGYLYYICQDGEPFGIYHPEIGVAAMKTYDASIFDGVISWHKCIDANCHNGWAHIVDPEKGAILDDFCLSRISWWAHQNSGGLGNLGGYAAFLQSRQQDRSHVPAPGLKSPGTIPNATNINTVWPGKGTAFGTTMMFYQDGMGVPHPMPDLFMDTLMITYTGGRNKLVYNTASGEKEIRFQDGHALLENYSPVAPFRHSIISVLETSTLEEMTFVPEVDADKLLSVTVTVKIATLAGEDFTIRRYYDSRSLRQGKMPVLMLWPFLPMPAGMEFWKDYYATWHDQKSSMQLLSDRNGEDIRLANYLSFDFKDQGVTRNVFRPTAQNQYWTVCNSQKPFRYALLTGKESEQDPFSTEMGMVFIPTMPTFSPRDIRNAYPVTGMPVKLAVDFGTTSTVCALRTHLLQGGQEIPLPFKDYSRTVTCDDPEAKKDMDMHHWLGNTASGPEWKWDKKIFSVAQLFQRIEAGGPNRTILSDAGRQEYYSDGRMFLVSGAAMMNYASTAGNGEDPLLEQQIMNDMKFNQKLDIKNFQAASLYLAGIYTYAVLYLLSERVIPGDCYIELLASYPNRVTMNALTNSWRYAKEIVDRMMAPVLTQPIQDLLGGAGTHFYSEAIAASAYHRRPLSPLNFVQSLVSLDIGGGTTDISITNVMHPGKARNLSLRYAGRELMVSSLIEYFRRFSKGSVFNLDDAFKGLWESGTEEEIQSLVGQFLTLCRTNDPSINVDYLHGLTTNSTVRMNVEMLLAEGLNMGKASATNTTNLLRQLIALKFMMVLRMVARTVHENIDLWVDPTTRQLSVSNKQLEINLSVSGTSAQLLQYIFDCDMQKLSLLQNAIYVTDEDTQRMSKCMELVNWIFTQELQGDLQPGESANVRIFIDQNVKEKREVCYGMLQNNIADYAPRAAAAAPGFPGVAAMAGVPAVPAAPAAPAASAAAASILSSFGLGAGAVAVPTAPNQPVIPGNNNEDSEREMKKAQMEMRLNMYPQENLEKYMYGETDAQGQLVKLGLVHFITIYEKIYFGEDQKANRGLGADVTEISRLLGQDKYTPHLSKAKTAVARTKAQYMIEPEQEPYLDLLSCMYLVDEILDWEMSAAQQ